MIYLDTGCLVKLYYPEPESAKVVRLIAGQSIVLLAIHELELSNALQLKLFRKEAKPSQVRATRALVEEDIATGVLHRPAVDWEDALRSAAALSIAHTRSTGCRSLDVLHCAAAQRVGAASFITTDARQRRLALAIGLKCPLVS
jgi:predicted nucleic acid-binding protein